MGIITAFEKAYEKKEKRGWKRIYVFVDVHETIFKPTYKSDQKDFTYYPFAEEGLIMLSRRKDIILGLSTCSYPDQIGRFLDKLESDGIHFDLINENPMEKNNSYACFDKKSYFNVLIEDKAGFDPDIEWYIIYKYFQKEYLIELIHNNEKLGLYDKQDNK